MVGRLFSGSVGRPLTGGAGTPEISGGDPRQGARRRPLRLIVLAPTPYRNSPHGPTNYRAPAYLLTTDLDRPAEVLVQCYLDRWQIEVNHREEKSQFGVGDAQVRNALSVPREPAFSARGVRVEGTPRIDSGRSYVLQNCFRSRKQRRRNKKFPTSAH